jgi:hypothetical protein
MRTTAQTHPYIDNPQLPGTCASCGRADQRRTNRAHQLPDTAQAQDEHRRRAGESEHE